MRAQSPIKVHEATKQKVRYAALMAGVKQAELVERAVDEYVERHRDQFAQRMESARQALLGGKTAALAHSLDVEGAAIERVGGVASDQLGPARRPRRATSNHASSPEGQSARGSQASASAASRTRPKSRSRSRSSTKSPSTA